jgi:hypothetical protein
MIISGTSPPVTRDCSLGCVRRTAHAGGDDQQVITSAFMAGPGGRTSPVGAPKS